MEPIMQWGIDLIIGVQKYQGPVQNVVFHFFTFLGNEPFYMVLLAFLWWCVDWRFAARLSAILLVAGFLNAEIKHLLHQPRPFEFVPALQMIEASGYGLPSGHAQMAVVLWGALANYVRKRWFWGVALAAIFFIGFSRIYLGVHFPTDVFGGWLLGAVLLVIHIRWQEKVETLLIDLRLQIQLLLMITLPAILLALHPLPTNATILGTLTGLGIGIFLLQNDVDFNAKGPMRQRARRFVIGLSIAVVLFVGLKILLPGEESPLHIFSRFVRYGLVSLWISLGGPLFFSRLQWSPEPERQVRMD